MIARRVAAWQPKRLVLRLQWTVDSRLTGLPSRVGPIPGVRGTLGIDGSGIEGLCLVNELMTQLVVFKFAYRLARGL